MRFLDLLRPRWKHSDPAVRRAAVLALGEDEAAALAQVASRDPDPDIRAIAIRRLADPMLLDELSASAPTEEERRAAGERLEAVHSRGGPTSLAALSHRLRPLDGRDAIPLTVRKRGIPVETRVATVLSPPHTRN